MPISSAAGNLTADGGNVSKRGLRPYLFTAVAALFIILSFQPALAAELTVSPAGAKYTSIRDAVAIAAAGDTIVVTSGTYNETVHADKTLFFRGADTGGGLPVIEPDKRGNAVEITADGCIFSGFTIRNAKMLSGIRVTSDRNTISGNSVIACSQGILLETAGNNVITGNNITQNVRSGIALESSDNNRIESNIITRNSIGITVDEFSSSNRILRNNFDNTVNVVSKSVTSVWDSAVPLQYRYLGTTQNSRIGNYWSDYYGKDSNGDGIGETPYVIQIGANKKAILPSNQDTKDSYPLMDPIEYYSRVTEAPLSPASTAAALSTARPVPSGTAEAAATTEPRVLSRISLPLKPSGALSAVLSALIVFVVVAGLAAGGLAFLCRRDRTGTGAGNITVPLDHPHIIAASYGVLGAMLALLTLGIMVTLAAVPPSSPVISGAWLLCALCICLSVSSFFLGRGVLRSEFYVTVATLHGILSALAVPVFSLFMVFAAERSEVTLFGIVAILAVSAALVFWHYGRFRQGPPVSAAVPEPAAASPLLPADTVLAAQVASTTTDPDRPDVTVAPASQQSFFPRELEGKYSDIRFIGRGGIAWVYSALRKTDGRKVAVKIPISFDEMTGKSFLNEIKAWEMLRHPNIVEISAVNILPVPFVEMEYVPGTLETVAKPVPVWKAVYIVRGIADALRYAHGLGIIHRDIKPHNILVTEDLTPKITDWGMSKVLATDAKKSSIAGFSLSYAAPEQVSPSEYGRTDVRTDIYQLGVLFYELVTGSIPFGGESIVTVGNAILREVPLPPSDYNPDASAVDRIILRCLEKDPAKRYQTAAELLNALSGYLEEDD